MDEIDMHISQRPDNYANLVLRIQKITIAMIRQDQQFRTENPTMQTSTLTAHHTIHITTALQWPRATDSIHHIKVQFKKLRKAKSPPNISQKTQVANFLHSLPITKGAPADPGITWLELLIADENQNGDYAPNPLDPTTGKPTTLQPRKNTMVLLQTFKRTVRHIITKAIPTTTQEAFQHTRHHQQR